MFLSYVKKYLKQLLANKFTLIGLAFLLITAITKPSEQAEQKDTYLHKLIEKGSLRQAALFLNAQGLNVTQKNSAGKTPLQILTTRATSVDFLFMNHSSDEMRIHLRPFARVYAQLLGYGAGTTIDKDTAKFIATFLPSIVPPIIVDYPTSERVFKDAHLELELERRRKEYPKNNPSLSPSNALRQHKMHLRGIAPHSPFSKL